MTNNPTIDGVSRELLLNKCACGSADISFCYESPQGHWILCDECGEASPSFENKGSALDHWNKRAPAVERQELKPVVRVCGAGYDAERNTVWMETGVVEMPIMRKVEVGEELVFLSEVQPTIARLEARITQLESEKEFAAATYQAARDRIAELESGRGEAPFYISVDDWNMLVRGDVEIASVRVSRTRRSKFTEPLFTAPPAPVAVVDKYDDVLLPFLAMMRNELHANAGKGDRPGWLSMTPGECLLEIYYHLGKLQKGVKDGNELWITEYSADVANMAMMLADICGLLDATAALNGSAK